MDFCWGSLSLLGQDLTPKTFSLQLPVQNVLDQVLHLSLVLVALQLVLQLVADLRRQGSAA